MSRHLDREKVYYKDPNDDDDGTAEPSGLLGGQKRLKNMKKHDILRLKNSDEAEKLMRIEQELAGHKELHSV